MGSHAGTEGSAGAGRTLQTIEDDHGEAFRFTDRPLGTHQRGEIRTVALGVGSVAAVALRGGNLGALGHVGSERLLRFGSGLGGTRRRCPDIALAKRRVIGKQLAGTAENAASDDSYDTASCENPKGDRLAASGGDLFFADCGSSIANQAAMGLGHVDRVLKVRLLGGRRHGENRLKWESLSSGLPFSQERNSARPEPFGPF